MIALSRMYLYVHYPTDVIAGIILGLLCGNIIIMLIFCHLFVTNHKILYKKQWIITIV